MSPSATKTRPPIHAPQLSDGSPHPHGLESLAFNPLLEALLQELDQRIERDALRGHPDALLIHLRSELQRQRRSFLRLSGADPMALLEAGAMYRERFNCNN